MTTRAPTPCNIFNPRCSTTRPTVSPTNAPTNFPSFNPTISPTSSPTDAPTHSPTTSPTKNPTLFPSNSPTDAPTLFPTRNPTHSPTKSPTLFPSQTPTATPTSSPTKNPTSFPTSSPSKAPTLFPTTANPTQSPTPKPTQSPINFPTLTPSHFPTAKPTTAFPTLAPSVSPSNFPTSSPTDAPSKFPTGNPTRFPTDFISERPTLSPIDDTAALNCIQFRVCKYSSQNCALNSECTSNSCDDGLCEMDGKTERINIVMLVLIVIMAMLSLSCYCCAWWKKREIRRGLLARKERSRRKTVNELGINVGLKKKCEGLVSENIKLRENFKTQFQNVSSIKVQNELDKAIWMHAILSLSAMFYSSLESEEKMSSRNYNHFLSDLAQVSQRLRFSLDMSHSKQSRENEVEKAQQEIILAAKLLPAIIAPVTQSVVISPQELLATYSQKDLVWGWRSDNFKKLSKVCQSLKPAFAKFNSEAVENSLNSLTGNRFFKGLHDSYLRFKRHWIIYTLFFLSLAAIFASFAARINSSSENLADRILFTLPPQYTIESDLQGIFIPIVYGCMHCALFCLALLPLPVCRGLWREISLKFPGIVKVLPINDFDRIHIQLGILTLLFLLTGALIWISVMTRDCHQGVENACLAFDPVLVTFSGAGTETERLSWGSPVDNVLVLRIIILCSWFPFLPLLYWAKNGNNLLILHHVKLLRKHWYEICYYTHVVVALASLILALVCRFQIFFVLIPTWTLYVFDRVLDRSIYTIDVALSERTVFSRDSLRSVPNSMRLKFLPVKQNLRVCAGQWIYLQVPAIDPTWHPFSLASASSEREIELHVGVISYPGDWDTTQGLRNSNPTWTAKLFQTVHSSNPNVKARIMGPYGWAFSSCFNAKKYAGSVVIGAGTGLTAAESVLREYIYLKRKELAENGGKKQTRDLKKTESFNTGSSQSHKLVPQKVWFIWSCKEVDDLLWCWNNLVRLIVDICEAGVVDIDTLIDPQSSMLDWLGVTIFVTRAKQEVMQEFRASFTIETEEPIRGKLEPEAEKPAAEEATELGLEDKKEGKNQISVGKLSLMEVEKKVKSWLYSRIIEGGLGDRETHIARYLNGCRNILDDTEEREKGLSVCFCGPSELSVTIQEAVEICPGNTKIEFSADHM